MIMLKLTHTINTEMFLETYTIDKEDIHFLGDHKWRTVYKGTKVISPYLVTGHTVYFHILIMGSPDCEIDHIDRNSKNNRKSNLRLASRQDQMYNTLKKNKTGVKGVYCSSHDVNLPWHAECQCDGIRYYSPHFETKEEAVYYRYLFETVLLKDFLVCNTQEELDCISGMSEETKTYVKNLFDRRRRISKETQLF